MVRDRVSATEMRLYAGTRINPGAARESWPEREDALCTAYEIIAGMYNALGITVPMVAKVSQFFNRHFKIIWGEKFALAIVQQITDPEVIPLTKRSLVGSIDIISDNTDVLEDASLRPLLKNLYQ